MIFLPTSKPDYRIFDEDAVLDAFRGEMENLRLAPELRLLQDRIIVVQYQVVGFVLRIGDAIFHLGVFFKATVAIKMIGSDIQISKPLWV